MRYLSRLAVTLFLSFAALAGPPSGATTVITYNDPGHADGISKGQILVYVKDASGNPATTNPSNIQLSSTIGAFTGEVVDGLNGLYFFSIRSSVHGLASITGTVEGQTIANTTQYPFYKRRQIDFDGDSYGDGPGEMGDLLPEFAIEDGLVPVDLQMDGSRACVLFDEGSVKCWGPNVTGLLGLGHSMGFPQGTPVTDLPLIDLGTGEAAGQITVGWGGHACALLESGRVKCWGDNSGGALGLEDTEDRGDDPGEMGDALPYLRFF